ncbi:HAD family hydrolase [Brevibacillus thermoruber]|uniref:HAD family hydrolase n=1 Tax=Brevibacillus thermoruber TaxID=33942 RepID=UPI000556E534|nr:HAD family hydrolase [Brevibacillus thermoruber]
MSKKRWITFDLDGTLMQNPFGGWVFPEIAAAVAGWLGRPYDIVAELVREHERRLRQGRYVEAYDWDGMLAELLGRLGIRESVEIAAIVQKHAVPPKIRLLEAEVPAVLAALQAKGYALAAVTNGFYKYQNPVMKVLGLAEYIAAVVTPERAGAGKPDPAIFRPLGGEVVAHVGDRLDHDVQLANRCGVFSVFVCRGLPEGLRAVDPRLRSRHDLMRQICLEKWKREGGAQTEGQGAALLPAELLPQAVIGTIGELPSLVDGLCR